MLFVHIQLTFHLCVCSFNWHKSETNPDFCTKNFQRYFETRESTLQPHLQPTGKVLCVFIDWTNIHNTQVVYRYFLIGKSLSLIRKIHIKQDWKVPQQCLIRKGVFQASTGWQAQLQRAVWLADYPDPFSEIDSLVLAQRKWRGTRTRLTLRPVLNTVNNHGWFHWW